MTVKTQVVPLILAGGSGTRLWPKSIPDVPKQYQAFFSAHTLFQQTALRTVASVHAMYAAPMISCSAAHADLVRQQLKSIDTVAQALILEPIGRNSAPAMAIAALHAQTIAPDALLLALPADHDIPDLAAFAKSVETGAPIAAAGDIVTLGVQPRGPETGYGYIQVGDARGPGVRRVLRFVEKPNRETAEKYLADGSYVWNAGIFLFSPAAMIGEFEAHAPDLLAQARRAYQDSAPTRHLVHLAEPSFQECNAISVDYAIMEKSKRVSVVPVGYAWSDLGSWASIWETAAKDADGNAVEGPVRAVECRNCLIFSDGPPISVMGLTDMIIVAANGRSMMLPRSHWERVGEMARADLKKAP